MAATIKAMLNTDRVSQSGLYPLVIRVIHNRRKKLIYSQYRIRESDFDSGAQKVLWNEEGFLSKQQVDEMNRFISNQRREIVQIIDQMERQSKQDYSVIDIISKYKKHSSEHYVFNFYEQEISSKRESKREGTASTYISSRNSLKRFVGNRNIMFKDITYKFICDYIDYLHARRVCDNTIHMYLRNLRAVYNKARKQGIPVSKNYPFSDIRTSVLPTVKRALSKEIVKSIAELDLSTNKTLDLVRDVFMFSFYTRGMSFVDMVFLKHSDIVGGSIYYVRKKTKQNIQVAITPPLQKLIDKYRSDSAYVLPYIDQACSDTLYHQYRKSLSTINFFLKQIGDLLGLDTPLTTYVARHSWANVAKAQGAPIATISEGLGHTTERTTQIYLRAFDKSVIDEINAQIVSL